MTIFEHSIATDIRVCSGTEAASQFFTNLNLTFCERKAQGLNVGVRSDELHAFNARTNHRIDSIATAAADTDNFDFCTRRNKVF